MLYKLKRAFAAVDEHGIADVGDAPEILDQYIEDAWTLRGLYPGLGAVVSLLADLAEGEPQKENSAGQRLVESLRLSNPSADLLDLTFELLTGTATPSQDVVDHKRTIRDARAGLRDNKNLVPILRKLSLFSFTSRQLARIIYPHDDGPHAFGDRNIDSADIARNPYLLAESYRPATDQGAESTADLDREQRTDGPIDYFTIDIGMFPDQRYIERDDDLQNLTVAGPERLRAFAIEALRRNEEIGHSFAPLGVLIEEARSHPLFYRDRIALTEGQFLEEGHLTHFEERLHVLNHDGHFFFYLHETKNAEEVIARFVKERVGLGDLNVDLSWLDGYLDEEAGKLAGIAGFDAEMFKKERCRLMEGALQQRFYCVTGRPGSGKTQALHALLDRLGVVGRNSNCSCTDRKGSAAPERGGQKRRHMESGDDRPLDISLRPRKIPERRPVSDNDES